MRNLCGRIWLCRVRGKTTVLTSLSLSLLSLSISLPLSPSLSLFLPPSPSRCKTAAITVRMHHAPEDQPRSLGRPPEMLLGPQKDNLFTWMKLHFCSTAVEYEDTGPSIKSSCNISFLVCYVSVLKNLSNSCMQATCGGGKTELRREIHFDFNSEFYTPQYFPLLQFVCTLPPPHQHQQ